MNHREDCAWEFSREAGQPIGIEITDDTLLFRIKLLKEEMQEVEEAADVVLYEHCCGKGASLRTRADLLKELCDLQYVLSGLLVTFGFDKGFDEAFDRVHKSNLSKFPATKLPDGKVTKGPNYKPPYLEDLV
jgi:predicted HAD superfamily Cof-like phosphohydrolase